jgi:hypothetical protein
VNHQPPNPLHKPVLDECAFHQLLSAAYTLQQQNGIEKVRVDVPNALAEKMSAELEHEPSQTASLKPHSTIPARVTPPVHFPVLTAAHAMVHRRVNESNEFFWGIATAVATASVSVLLLGASINHFSPLPAGLAPTSEAVQRQTPSRRATPITTILDQSSGAGSETVATEPDAATEDAPVPQMAVDQSARSKPRSVHKKTLNRRRHSAHTREADIIAPNTVVRYGRQSPAPLEQAHKYP